MEGNANNFDGWMAKAIPLCAIAIGATIKLGDDLLNKRELTPLQRMGLYLITIGFGFVGWWICIAFNLNDWRLPIVISSLSYSGEYALQWFVKNRMKIFDYITFKTFNKK